MAPVPQPQPPEPTGPTLPTRRAERGDAGLPAILITPLLLFMVLHLINASQQLYERREAYAVAATATRVANQGDPTQVRLQRTAAIDEGKASDAVEAYVSSEGYQLASLQFTTSAAGATTVTVEVERPIDYLFPIPTLLPGTITGKAEATLIAGVTGPGQ